MSQLLVSAAVAAVSVLVWLSPPSAPMARLRPAPRWSMPTWVMGRIRRAPDDSALAAQLPDALCFLAVCLEAGQPMAGAVAVVAETSPGETRALLREVAAQLALGRAGPAAWESLRTHPVWGMAAADIVRSERSGTSLTGVLRMHAADARQEASDAALKAARTVGVRSVLPLMACFLPAFMLIGVVPIIASLITNFFAG